MSVSIQTILENHELRIRKMEGTISSNSNSSRSETQYDTEITNIKTLIETTNLGLNKEIQNNYNDITEKYNNLYELHCLLMKEFLKLKNYIEDKEKIELVIEEKTNNNKKQ